MTHITLMLSAFPLLLPLHWFILAVIWAATVNDNVWIMNQVKVNIATIQLMMDKQNKYFYFDVSVRHQVFGQMGWVLPDSNIIWSCQFPVFLVKWFGCSNLLWNYVCTIMSSMGYCVSRLSLPLPPFTWGLPTIMGGMKVAKHLLSKQTFTCLLDCAPFFSQEETAQRQKKQI